MLANGAKETTTTTGTGTVTLTAVTGFPRFSQVLSVGQFVDYAIQDGNNWEWGVGRVAAGNTLERTLITAKFDGGTYSKNPATALSLSGGATVFCSITDATDGVAGPGPLSAGTDVGNALFVQTSAYLQNTSFGDTGKVYWFPWAWPQGIDRFATGVRVRVNATGTATKMRVAVVEYGQTQAENRLITQTGDISVTTTGVKTGSFPAPVALPLARYGLAVMFDGTVNMTRSEGFVPDMGQLSAVSVFGRRAVSDTTYAGWSGITTTMIKAYCTGVDAPEQLLIQMVR